MSLADKKNALFGKGSGPPKAENKEVGKAVPKPIERSSLSAASNSATTSTSLPTKSYEASTSFNSISPELKAKKLAEAQDYINKATKYLETSLFTWNPDYLGAAPCYDKASNLYKGINELEKSRDAMIRSAECHQKANCLTAAALAYTKAAPLAQVHISMLLYLDVSCQPIYIGL